MGKHRKRNKSLGLLELIAIALGGMVGGGVFTISGISVSMIYPNRIAFRVIRQSYFFSQQSKKSYCNGLLLDFLMQMWKKRTKIKTVKLFDLGIGTLTPIAIIIGGLIAALAAYSYVKLGLYYIDEGVTYSFYKKHILTQLNSVALES